MKENNSHLGGKATKLLELLKADFPVPNLIVLTTSELESYFNLEDKTSFLKNIWQKFENKNVAVRSSAQGEDGISNSFAGIFHTELNVDLASLENAIEKVWNSTKTAHAKTYLSESDKVSSVQMNIIIQEQIDSFVSGVAFSANPLTGNSNEIVINAVFGLGEGLVSGELIADQFIIDSTKIERIIAEKNEQFILSKESKIEKVVVNKSDRNKVTLSDNQLLEIKNILSKVNERYGLLQEIEFAFDQNEKLHLLQSRPITTPHGKVLNVYDNSNIIESYPGLSSPLTFSFIEKMYASVYQQLSELLGVPKATIEENKPMYESMLTHIKGRVYYHLNSWYKAISLVPGYQLNAEFMEKMMGVKERFEIDFPTKNSKWKERRLLLRSIFHLLKAQRKLPKERLEFQAFFKSILTKYEAIDFNKLSDKELLTLYFEYEETLVKKWNAPLVNDFFAMIYFGVLNKLVVKYHLDEAIHNDLLAGSNDIISRAPADLCISISKKIITDEVWKKAFLETDEVSLWKELKDKKGHIYLEIEMYLKNWGARSVGELKLETITFQQAPERFIKLLKNYVSQGITESIQAEKSSEQRRSEAEQKVRNQLSWKQRKIFFYVLKKSRDLVSMRENLRYERTKGFALVRKFFLALDEKLLTKNSYSEKRSVFWLTQTEISDLVFERKHQTEIQNIIEVRKKQYAKWEAEILPERLKNYTSDIHFYFNDNLQNNENADLKGIPCSSGIVEREVIVIHSPDEIESLNGAILVTSSTDPGWVSLFPTASAILVERGSLLSHSAIVSREMGIPCIVGVTGIMQKLKTGDIVRMNGSTGEIELIKKDEN